MLFTKVQAVEYDHMSLNTRTHWYHVCAHVHAHERLCKTSQGSTSPDICFEKDT